MQQKKILVFFLLCKGGQKGELLNCDICAVSVSGFSQDTLEDILDHCGPVSQFIKKGNKCICSLVKTLSVHLPLHGIPGVEMVWGQLKREVLG